MKKEMKKLRFIEGVNKVNCIRKMKTAHSILIIKVIDSNGCEY